MNFTETMPLFYRRLFYRLSNIEEGKLRFLCPSLVFLSYVRCLFNLLQIRYPLCYYYYLSEEGIKLELHQYSNQYCKKYSPEAT